MAAALLLAACASDQAPRGSGRSMFGSIFGADLAARQPRNSPDAEPQRASGMGEIVYLGAPSGNPTGATLASHDPGSISLNFQNADMREVVQSILGDTLQLNYTIEPTLVGTMTISSARPVARDDLLPILEAALQINGAALVKSADGYKIVAAASAAPGWADVGDATPGYGVSILPLRYVSARTLINLIDGFAARPGSIRAEPSHNLLIVVGTGSDRKSAIETALSFDQDWMQDQSVAILPLRNTKPETIIPELERIFKANQGNLGADLVQFVPMSRLKAVLVVSSQREMIERAKTWVQRLDNEDSSLDARVYVYRVKYRDAPKLAQLLNQLFGTGAASASSEPASQIQPNAPPLATESDTPGADLVALPPTDAAVVADVVSDQPSTGKRVRIQADASNNSIVIFADAETRQDILAALGRIDVPQLQVAINVTMAEIRLTDQLRYGVQFYLQHQDEGSVSLFGAAVNQIGQEVPGFNFLLGTNSSPDVVISAFDQITDVQILSSPSLVVVENETARFQVGDQIPIITRTVTSVQDSSAPVSNEIEYRDTGIILQVKPRVSENGVVSLEIEQEISSVAGGSATLTPTITNRKVSSSISVADGQTVLLGGLISEQSDRGKSGIPGLHRLQGIGNLFGRTGKGSNRIELIILIRPSVIRDSQDAQHVAEELRSRMWTMEGPPRR
jgi:general secretion pathway protein D